MWKAKVRRHLNQALQARGESGDISLRELALGIGISSGALSEILSGKRKLTLNLAKRIVPLLPLDENKREKLLEDLDGAGEVKRQVLDDAGPDLVSSWVYFAVLSVLELDKPPGTPEEVASHLGVSPEVAKQALMKLHEAGHIEEVNGRYETLHAQLTSSDDLPSERVATRHQANLDLARLALERVQVPNRDFTSLTFSASTKQMAMAKRVIRRFLERLANDMSEGPLECVYQVNVQLFPIDGWQKGG